MENTEQPKFELVKFYGNWADEMDIQSFTITPKGLLEELLIVSEEYFKTNKELEIYVGSNEIIYFEQEDPKNPYKDTLKSTFSSTEITSEEKEVLKTLFKLDENSLSFNINVLERLLNILVDTIPEEDFEAKVYPLIYAHLN